jgi:hypothetical protein
MQLKGAMAVLVTAFTIGGAGVRAEQQQGTPAALVTRPLRFTLAPKAPVPAWPRLRTQIAPKRPLIRPRPRLESTIAADTAAKWNCGMPVVQPPADVDPKFERRPDERISVAIRRAAPPSCRR